MQLEYAKNPVWANAEHTLIDLTIKWDGINEEFPFTANPNDCEEHGRVIFAAAAAGAYGSIGVYVPQHDPMINLAPLGGAISPTPPSGEIRVTTFE
jgi:hypothetical protein